jgi:hypothetical protein
MARPSTAERLAAVHQTAMTQFDTIQSALRDERLQCLQDRRFVSINGAQWEGPLWDQYENKPKLEVNKIALAVQRIFSEYRNNRITVDFVSKDGSKSDELADICDGLYRADEQDSVAEEAYDNAFDEAVTGGFGAWQLTAVYEDEEDPENERQRIKIEPIFDADSSVFFDLNAKRQDKSDAKHCFVITSMTREAYKAEWNDDPASWPKEIHQYEFDWLTPDVVFVAKYYVVESVSEKMRVYRMIDGSEERYKQSDFDADETLEETLAATGATLVRERSIKRQRVHMYIMSGRGVLEDCGYIAGKYIPIVPVYGKRWFIDNVERCMGHVRLAKDAQRLKNMQLSKLAEISALSSIKKPIFTPEQMAGHQVMWSEDNVKNWPYLLVNPVTAPDGTTQVGGPVGYTEPPDVPPAMGALLQLTEQDMKDILGNQEQGDKIVSNISGAAVEMVQQRLDMQTFIYMSNQAKAVRWGGQIWLSMAKEIYVEQGRKMKTLGTQNEVGSIELMQPTIGETGEIEYRGDLSRANFDVNVDVGPSYRSQRSAIVRVLSNILGVAQDPETQKVLLSAILMNVEGEGLSDVREYSRRTLVQMGVVKPNEEEAAAMAQAAQQPDLNAELLAAAAEEAQAKATKAKADAVKTMAEVDLTRAKTVETLEGIGQAGAGVMQPLAPPDEKTALELEAMRLENEMRRRRVEATDTEVEQLRAERQANDSMVQASQAMQEAVAGLGQTVAVIGDAVGKMGEAVGQFAETSRANTDKAIAAISRPKRVVREKGRIARIETEE